MAIEAVDLYATEIQPMLDEGNRMGILEDYYPQARTGKPHLRVIHGGTDISQTISMYLGDNLIPYSDIATHSVGYLYERVDLPERGYRRMNYVVEGDQLTRVSFNPDTAIQTIHKSPWQSLAEVQNKIATGAV